MAPKKEGLPPKPPPAEQVSTLELFRFATLYDIYLLAMGVFGACAMGAVRPVNMILFGNMLDALSARVSVQEAVTEQAVNYCYLAIGAGVVGFFQAYGFTVVAERQANAIRRLFLRALLHTEVGYFDTASSGGLVSHMASDMTAISAAIGEKAGVFIQANATFVSGMIVGLFYGWKLTLVVLGCLPFLIASGVVNAKAGAKLTASEHSAYADAGSIAQEAFANVRTVFAFTGERRAIAAFGAALDKSIGQAIRQRLYAGLGAGWGNMVMFCSFSVCLWFGTYLIHHGGMTGGAVVTTFFSIVTAGSQLGQAAPSLDAFARGRGSAFKIFKIIDRKPLIDPSSNEGRVLEKVTGAIELRDIHFAYAARAEVTIFDGFSLSIPAGKNTALVGESGSGKSTAIQLVLRFYDPLKGSVTLDGVDLRDLNVRWLRRQIGLVAQEPVLFACSVRENLLYGNPEATDEEIVAACTLARAHGFISQLQEGYGTYVGDRGMQMSGGQKQRIAIARAVLKRPKILLLDEASSALDSLNERLVQEALDEIEVGLTTITVAHRLTTIRNAHTIVVMRKGLVVESGSHDELVRDEAGAYSALLCFQAGARPSEGDDEEAGGGGALGRRRRGSAANASAATLPTDGEAEAGGSPAPGAPAAAQAGERPGDGEAQRGAGGDGPPSDSAAPADVAVSPQDLRVDVSPPAKPGNGLAHGKGTEAAADGADAGGKPAKGKASARPSEAGAAAKLEDLPPVPMSRIARLGRPDLGYFIFGVIGSAGLGARMPILAIIMSKLFVVFTEADQPEKMARDAQFWALILVALGFGVATCTALDKYCAGVVGQRLAVRARKLAFSAALRCEVAFFDDTKNATGALGARLANDAALIRALVTDGVLAQIQNLSTLATAFIIAFIGGWPMTLVMVGVMPVTFISYAVAAKQRAGIALVNRSLYERASQVATDAVSNIRTVAAFTAEDRVLALFDSAMEGPVRSVAKQGRVAGLSNGFSSLMYPLPQAFAFDIGGIFIHKGIMTFGEVMQVFLALLMAAISMGNMSAATADVGKAKPATAALFALVDREPAIDNMDPSGLAPEKCLGAVSLRDVVFEYPSRPGLKILKGLTLDIPAGTMAALVGESGSGKSTVIQLVLRFYDPVSGSVYLDGFDLRSLRLSWLRSHVGIVAQEPQLFSATLRENILYGREGADDDAVRRAATQANVLDFIEGLPGGLDTEVGERGVQLSGGQRQRIAIARAMLREPRVILLDEATSALDNESEKVVQAALEALMVGRTTIAVAHRLSSIRHADIIAVVAHGSLLEKGTHDELVASKGKYAELMAIRNDGDD